MKIKEVGTDIPYRIKFKRDVVVYDSRGQIYTWQKERLHKVTFRKGYIIEFAQGNSTYAIGEKGPILSADISNPGPEVKKIQHILHVYDRRYKGYIYLDAKDVDILPANKGVNYRNSLRDGYDLNEMFGFFYGRQYLPSYEENMKHQHPEWFE